MPKPVKSSKRKPAKGSKQNAKAGVNALMEFSVWLDSLAKHDRDNFRMLLTLPDAVNLVARLDEGKYKEMCIIGLAIAKLVASKSVEER